MTTYKRLGDYIREVNVRNRELKVTKLVGLTIDKAFIPSVANVIGTDLSNYKVIQREQFACSLILMDGANCKSNFSLNSPFISFMVQIYKIKKQVQSVIKIILKLFLAAKM